MRTTDWCCRAWARTWHWAPRTTACWSAAESAPGVRTGWRSRTGVDVKLIAGDDGSVTYVAGTASPESSSRPGHQLHVAGRVQDDADQEQWRGRCASTTRYGADVHSAASWKNGPTATTTSPDFSYDAQVGRPRSSRPGAAPTARKATVTYNAAGRLASYRQTGTTGRRPAR